MFHLSKSDAEIPRVLKRMPKSVVMYGWDEEKNVWRTIRVNSDGQIDVTIS